MLESQENPQNLLRQQEAKTRAWFTFVFGKAELLVQVSYYQNIGVDESHHHLMLINAPNHS